MKNILIIDDSKSVHAFVKHCLTGYDAKIDSAMNGQEGIDLLSKKVKNYDLILLDWEMPVKDGPSTLPEITSIFENPILMMTSRNSMDDIQKMMGLGASEYIMKPFTKDILLGKLEPFMELKYEAAS